MMMLNNSLFRSEKNNWETPQDFYSLIQREFLPNLDVCAEHHTAKCQDYFTIEDNGLSQVWRNICWMNPPYGREIKLWVAKADFEARENLIKTIALLPARIDAGWWWEYCKHWPIRFLKGRLKFEGAKYSAPFPSALVMFGFYDLPPVMWWDWKREVVK